MGRDASGVTEGAGDGDRRDRASAGDGPSRRRVLRLASGAGAALAGAGTAGLHGVVGATTPTDSAPPAPTDLEVTETSPTTISLEWSVPDASGIDHFTTYVDGGGYPLVENDRPSVYLAGLNPGETRDIAVEAVGPDGTSSARATTTATTDTFDVPGLEVTQFAVGLSKETEDVRDYAEVSSFVDDDEGQQAVVTGRLSDPEPCTYYYLGDVSFEDGTLSVVLTTVPVGPSDCGPAYLPTNYIVNMNVPEEPDAVEVRHPDWERSAPIDEWGIPTVDGERPRDLDNDGRYMDLNANGKLDVADAVTYFQHSDEPALTDRPHLFDYDWDDDLDVADTMALLGEL